MTFSESLSIFGYDVNYALLGNELYKLGILEYNDYWVASSQFLRTEKELKILYRLLQRG